jgi:hypothetical protein
VGRAVGLADEAAPALRLVDNACSFSAETRVATAEGLRAIGDLRVGDEVLAWDEATGTTGRYRITAVWVHEDAIVEELTVDGETLTTTPEHPFFVEGRGWVPAGELREGQRIRRADGGSGIVQGVRFEQRPQVMYNLTVDTAHTFFVGDGQWLVHNTCRPTEYTVAFEMTLDAVDIPTSHGTHVTRAAAAFRMAKRDRAFRAQLERTFPDIHNTRRWVWHHHETRVGVMQFVPKYQHTNGSAWWRLMHSDGVRGGYELWAIPAGAAPRPPR